MKKLIGVFCFALVMALFTSQVQADCGKCDAKGDSAQCDSAKCDADCCPVGKAMAALPKMTYSVGDESTCCVHAAKALVEKDGGHIHYVVAEEEYDSEENAWVALADVTEKFVNDFATPHKCDVSGKTSIAGTSLACSESAAKLAAIAKEAMATVAISYKVGDEVCHCPNEAATLAEKSGAKKEFVIGEETTCCSIDAKIKLAHAKYRAAVQAIVKASEEAQEATTQS